MTDLEPLVREIINNASGRITGFTRADAIQHIRVYRKSLEIEGRIPPGTVLHDNGETLRAVELTTEQS